MVQLSDVMRVLMVYAEDVGHSMRPPRGTLQAMLRRLSALSDTERQGYPCTGPFPPMPDPSRPVPSTGPPLAWPP